MTATGRITFHPATPDRWQDLETLFGSKGACGGCWCMTWRLKRSDFDKGKGEGNKRALRDIVERNDVPGIIACAGGVPIGWCSVAPREEFSALTRSRVLAPVDDAPVWSITCLFISKAYRRKGLSTRLIEAAVAMAAKRGAKIVEAYPVVPYSDPMPAAFAWTGLASTYVKADFVEVARRSTSRPVLRRVIHARCR